MLVEKTSFELSKSLSNRQEKLAIVKKYFSEILADEISFKGFYPINEHMGRDAYIENYLFPLIDNLSLLEIRKGIFISGVFKDKKWVSSVGIMAGVLRGMWLGIRPTKKLLKIRYGEFFAVENGKISTHVILIDLLDVFRQTGNAMYNGCMNETNLSFPPPKTQDGVILGQVEEKESSKTLSLVEKMLENLMQFKDGGWEIIDNGAYWSPKMWWYGPCVIGSPYTIKEYERMHHKPFLKAFPDRMGGNHLFRFAEGNYASSGGWPSINATHSGSDWIGLPATNKKITMRVMDWWRREDDFLCENWVFIDIPHLLNQLGIDIFSQAKNNVDFFTSVSDITV